MSSIKVPEIMRERCIAVVTSSYRTPGFEGMIDDVLAIALLVQSENPPVPTPEQSETLVKVFAHADGGIREGLAAVAVYWFRICYAVEEPDAEIADLLWSENVSRPYSIDQHNAQIRKLYERMKAVRDAK